MNLDDRIEKIVINPPVSGYEWAYDTEDGEEQKNDIKQLIRDVLNEVKPLHLDRSVLDDYGRGYSVGGNTILDEIEHEMKELGL